MADKSHVNFLPLVGSDVAQQWDYLFIFLVVLSFAMCVGIFGTMAWFLFKYREKGSPRKVGNVIHNQKAEFLWTFLPTVLVIFIFAWAWMVYKRMSVAPEGAIEIRVIGKQWLWQFQYDNGYNAINELVVPENIPVRMIMTSDDVLHSFFIPDFRIKNDVVPGRYTSVWFRARKVGEHLIFCAEYCGTAHSKMLANLKVVPLDEWRKWLSDSEKPAERPASLTAWGQQLWSKKGCNACHSLDGVVGVGPSFKGIWGKTVEMSDGSKNLVDENYIRESIEYPGGSKDKIVKGFQPVMPSFKGLIDEEELNAIIALIKSLKE